MESNVNRVVVFLNRVWAYLAWHVPRILANRHLRLRWMVRSRSRAESIDSQRSGLDRCRIVYINLDHREDRRVQIEGQFRALGLQRFERFSAVKREKGALGCTESHLGVLEAWPKDSRDLLMVCEDDCEFLLQREDIDNLIEKFALNSNLNVLCLAFNAFNGVKISDEFKITSMTLTTACYVIKPHARNQFLEAALRSVESFLPGREPVPIDVAWLKAQKELFFAIPIRRAARQMASFSDIQMQTVDYGL